MKIILLCCICLLPASAIFAQTHTVTIDFQKSTREALESEVGYSQNTVFGAIDQSMSNRGYKAKSQKDFVLYKGVSIPELGGSAYDLYFSVDKKSPKDNTSSLLRMMISKGGDDFITASSDAEVIGRARTYLDSLQKMVAIYDYDQQVLAQSELVKKQERKLKGLIDDSYELEKKKRHIEEQIKENGKAQSAQQEELENQQKILVSMKSSRKG